MSIQPLRATTRELTPYGLQIVTVNLDDGEEHPYRLIKGVLDTFTTEELQEGIDIQFTYKRISRPMSFLVQCSYLTSSIDWLNQNTDQKTKIYRLLLEGDCTVEPYKSRDVPVMHPEVVQFRSHKI